MSWRHTRITTQASGIKDLCGVPLFTLHPLGYSTWNGYGMDRIHKIGYGFHGIGDGFHFHRYVFHGMCDGFHFHSTPSFHLHSMVILLSFHGHSMVIPLSFHGHFMLIPWSFHSHSMVIPLSFHGHSMVIPTLFHLHSIWNPDSITCNLALITLILLWNDFIYG